MALLLNLKFLLGAAAVVCAEQPEGLVFLQQKVQRLQPEELMNMTFAEAKEKAMSEKTAEEMALDDIYMQVRKLQTSVTEDHAEQLLSYKTRIQAEQNRSMRLRLVNERISAQIEDVRSSNKKLNAQAAAIRKESGLLTAEVRELRANMSAAIVLATTALDQASERLDERASELLVLGESDNIALLALSAHREIHQKPAAVMQSLLQHLHNLSVRHSLTAAAMQVAFIKELKMAAAASAKVAKTQHDLNNTLEQVQATHAKLVVAVQHLTETKIRLLKMRAQLRGEKVEEAVADALALANDTLSADVPPAKQLSAPKGEGCVASDEIETDDAWSKQWLGEKMMREKYGNGHFDTLLKSEHVEKRQNPNCPERTQYHIRDEQQLMAALHQLEDKCQPPPPAYSNVIASKVWVSEKMLHQKYGQFDTRLQSHLVEIEQLEMRQNPDCPERTQYFVKDEQQVLAIVRDNFCEPHSEDKKNMTKVWMGEKLFRERYGDNQFDLLLTTNHVQKRQNPNCPERTQYYVKDEQQVLAIIRESFCELSSGDTNWTKVWVSEKKFREKFGNNQFERLFKTGRVQKRQNPNCPERTQYFVNDEQHVLTAISDDARSGEIDELKQRLQRLQHTITAGKHPAEARKPQDVANGTAKLAKFAEEDLQHPEDPTKQHLPLSQQNQSLQHGSWLKKEQEKIESSSASAELPAQAMTISRDVLKTSERKTELENLRSRLGQLEAMKAKAAEAQAESSTLGCSPAEKECDLAVHFAMSQGLETHPAWYPGLSKTSSYEDFQAHFARMRSAKCKCSPSKMNEFYEKRKAALEQANVTLVDDGRGGRPTCEPSEDCQRAVKWALEVGVYQNPAWYGNLGPKSTFKEMQNFIQGQKKGGSICFCKKDIETKSESEMKSHASVAITSETPSDSIVAVKAKQKETLDLRSDIKEAFGLTLEAKPADEARRQADRMLESRQASSDLGKEWISERTLRETYGAEKIAKMMGENLVETRDNPDIPGRKQYYLKSKKVGHQTKGCGKPTEQCAHAIQFAIESIENHPEWYPGLTKESSAADFQEHLAKYRKYSCECQSLTASSIKNAMEHAMKTVKAKSMKGVDEAKSQAKAAKSQSDSKEVSEVKAVAASPPASVNLKTEASKPANTRAAWWAKHHKMVKEAAAEKKAKTASEKKEVLEPQKKSWMSWLIR